MAKMGTVEVKVKFTNKVFTQLVAEALGVEIIDKDAFEKRVNEVLVNFVIPRLPKEQMRLDGIIEIKNGV